MDDPISVTAADFTETPLVGEALHALNNSNKVELSWLEPGRMQHLVTQAFLARRIGLADAFLLAFDQDAAYDSPNFLWFRAAGGRFVYVDRVVVAAFARRRGLALRLYRDLFDHAIRAGHDRVVCEVNLDPPNPDSDAFHATLGFTELGKASIHDGLKTVRYLERRLHA